jgi:hypothetical protein
VLEETGSTSSEQVIAPPPPRREADETMERNPVRPPSHARDSGNWTVSALAAPPLPPGQDDWVVTNVAAAVRVLEHEETVVNEDGTPVEGTSNPATEGAFVAGEIDVPSRPENERVTGEHDTPAVEFTAAGPILGPSDADDPDTGSRTPSIQRR